MKKHKNLVTRNREISQCILESMYLLDILEKLIDGEARADVIIRTMRKHLKCGFREIETCRKIVAFGE